LSGQNEMDKSARIAKFLNRLLTVIGNIYLYSESFFAALAGVVFLFLVWALSPSATSIVFLVFGFICLYMSRHLFNKRKDNHD
jgi:asparagine N-glycosylation enzyme membrane subunit Stt3